MLALQKRRYSFLAMPPNNEVIRYFYAGIARKTLFIFGQTKIPGVITTPDEEQQEIIDLLKSSQNREI